MKNFSCVIAGILIIILLSGCIGVMREEEHPPETTLTTLQAPTTTICRLNQETCNSHCGERCGSKGVDYCLFDESGCNCKYKCGRATTTITTTTTISGRVDCSTYCRKIGYMSGTCRINPGECRTRGVKEVYKVKGNKYCPKNRPEDSCCCRIE